MKWIACADRVDWEEVDADVLGEPAWCGDPVIDRLGGATIGFIGCEEDLDRHVVERRLRSAGVDPIGVPVLRLSAVDRSASGRIAARMASAAARADAYAGSRPEHLRPVMPPTSSRRTFLTLRAPAYRVVPRPDASRCGAGDGCRACVAVCPHGALGWSRGSIQHDRLACEGCGRCVTTCPVGAMVNPAFTHAQLQAEISGFASRMDEQFGVVLHCSRMATPDDRPGWLRVAVPCVGMLPAHWVLAPLFAGAAAVAVDACRCGKESDSNERAQAAMAAAREWLNAAGRTDADERVMDTTGPVPPKGFGATTEVLAFAPSGGAAVAGALAPVHWESELSPVGSVTIDSALCTGCEMCATVCPANALRTRHDDGCLAIVFDPRTCTACGQCVSRCPEPEAIALRRVVDSDRIEQGTRDLVQHELVRCVKCGGSVATSAVLNRLAESIGDDAVYQQISSICLDCRGTTMVF